MKNSSRIIDRLAPRTGEIEIFKDHAGIQWFKYTYQVILFSSNQLREKLEDGSPRYAIT